ncbi:hypothetical protein [Psychromonas marina]|nr:hypothetical protein [Psychromonas marina]
MSETSIHVSLIANLSKIRKDYSSSHQNNGFTAVKIGCLSY